MLCSPRNKKRPRWRSFLCLGKIVQCVVDALVDKFASAHVELRGKRVNLRQLIGGNPDRDGFLGILLRDEISHGNHLLQYSMLWCMLNIDSKLAYFIAYERRTQWTIRRCIPPYSTRSPTHFPKSKHKITATPKKHLSLPSKKQKKSISQHKTKKGAPRRGERSNAAPARSLPPCCRHSRLTIVRRGCV